MSSAIRSGKAFNRQSYPVFERGRGRRIGEASPELEVDGRGVECRARQLGASFQICVWVAIVQKAFGRVAMDWYPAKMEKESGSEEGVENVKDLADALIDGSGEQLWVADGVWEVCGVWDD